MANKQDYIRRLQLAIVHLHGYGAIWRETVPVHVTFHDQTLWRGEVEVFDLHKHPEAKRCYGWSNIHGQKDDKERFVTVLEIPPVDSALKAVQVQIVKDAKENHIKRSIFFRIILVLLGMVSLTCALLFLLFGFIAMSNVPKEIGHDGHEIFFVLFGLLLGAISIYLFCGAPHISRSAQSKCTGQIQIRTPPASTAA